MALFLTPTDVKRGWKKVQGREEWEQHLLEKCAEQWRRLHGARGARAPTFRNAGQGEGTVSRRIANKKLTKLYWPSRKRSPKRLIVLLEPKSGGAQPIFFQIRSGTTDPTRHNTDHFWGEREKSRLTDTCSMFIRYFLIAPYTGWRFLCHPVCRLQKQYNIATVLLIHLLYTNDAYFTGRSWPAMFSCSQCCKRWSKKQALNRIINKSYSSVDFIRTA